MASDEAWESGTEGDARSGTEDAGRWLLTILALGVVWAGHRWISIPGVDQEALAWFPQARSAVALWGVAPWVLILVTLIESQSDFPRSRRWPLVYLVSCLALGWFAIGRVEGLSVRNTELVDRADTAFRALALGTWLGGAALYAWLADRVTERGVGSGFLVLPLAFALQALWWTLAWAGMQQATNVGLGLPVLAWALSAVGLLVLLALREPAWPWSLFGGVPLRSWVDVVALPLVGVSFALLLAVLAGVDARPVPWLGVAIAAVVGWRLGSQPRRTSLLPGVAAALLLALGSAGVLWGFVYAGGIERALAPGPFEGPEEVVVVLEADPFEPSDAEVLEQRLAALKIDGSVEVVDRTLRLRLEGVQHVDFLVEGLLRPGALAIHGLSEGLTRQLALRPTLVVQPEFEVVQKACDLPPCDRLVLLPELLGPDDFVDVELRWPTPEEPEVVFHTSEDGAVRLAEHTRKRVRERIVIRVDGTVVLTPVVAEPLEDGSLVVPAPGGARSSVA